MFAVRIGENVYVYVYACILLGKKENRPGTVVDHSWRLCPLSARSITRVLREEHRETWFIATLDYASTNNRRGKENILYRFRPEPPFAM